MRIRKGQIRNGSRGQSLVETAAMLPVLVLLILNAVNYGYFLLVTINLTSATRSGIEYAIQGSSTPANGSLPAAGTSLVTTANTVSSLIAQELGGLNAGTLQVQVCSLGLGSGSGSPPTTTCQTAGGGTFAAPDADPEWSTYPGYALNRVDVAYTFKPLIAATPFSLAVLSSSACSSSGGSTTCKFRRHAEMRAMGS
jgi:Flp pilus assembly protein TadG